MKLSEVLEAGLAEIRDPAKWVQGALFLNKEGNETLDVKAACQMCSIGALHFALDKFGIEPEQRTGIFGVREITRRFANVIQGNQKGMWFSGMVSFNDYPTTTHEMVVEVWDKVIADIKKEEDANEVK